MSAPLFASKLKAELLADIADGLVDITELTAEQLAAIEAAGVEAAAVAEAAAAEAVQAAENLAVAAVAGSSIAIEMADALGNKTDVVSGDGKSWWIAGFQLSLVDASTVRISHHTSGTAVDLRSDGGVGIAGENLYPSTTGVLEAFNDPLGNSYRILRADGSFEFAKLIFKPVANGTTVTTTDGIPVLSILDGKLVLGGSSTDQVLRINAAWPDVRSATVPTLNPNDAVFKGNGLGPLFTDMAKFAAGGSSTIESMNSNLSAMATSLGATSYWGGGLSGARIQHLGATMGAVPALVTIADNQIPASGAVAVTVSNVPFRNGTSFTGTLGGVAGTLASTGSAWSFTRTSSGSAVTIEADTPFIPTAALTYRDAFWLLNPGKNNFKDSGVTGTAAWLLDRTHELVSFGPHIWRGVLMNHFINSDFTNMVQINAFNAGLKAAYGRNVFDLQGVLSDAGIWSEAEIVAAAITPDSADYTAQAAGALPPSLAVDEQHMGVPAKAVVARKLKAHIQTTLGYY